MAQVLCEVRESPLNTLRGGENALYERLSHQVFVTHSVGLHAAYLSQLSKKKNHSQTVNVSVKFCFQGLVLFLIQ